ncbi:Abi family protein [Ureibacillus composti]
MSKPFLTVDKQVDKLILKGLIIKSRTVAEKQLLKTSYYDLINGYKNEFLYKSYPEDPIDAEDAFIEGTTLYDLLNIYNLDRELRQVVMRTCLDVECNFYTALAYNIANKYGELEANYLNKNNYKLGKRQFRGIYERDGLFSIITPKITNPSKNALMHYKSKYGNIPPWILVKDLSFGNFIVWYKLSPQDVKENVIKDITGLTPTPKVKEMFMKSMEIFNKFRNVSAHGGLMYNYRTKIELPYQQSLHDIFYIDKNKYDLRYGKTDFSAFILALKYIYQNNSSFLIENTVYLNSALDVYKKNSPLHFDKVLDILGLPNDFHNRSLQFLSNNFSI